MPPALQPTAAEIVSTLADERVRAVLAQVADHDREVYSRLRALACPLDLEALLEAARDRVEAALLDFDWAGDWKDAGEHIKWALSELRNDRPEPLAQGAVLIVLLENLVEGTRDHYGLLAETAACWLFEGIAKESLPTECWGRARAELAELACTVENGAFESMRAVHAGPYPIADYALATLFDSSDVLDIEAIIAEKRQCLQQMQASASEGTVRDGDVLDDEISSVSRQLRDWERFHETLVSVHTTVESLNSAL